MAGWLLGIARNKLRESRRHGRVEDSARRRLGLQPVAITDADLERVDELVSLDPEILARVAAPPQEQRAALHSRIVGERSYAEIAGELRCSEVLERDDEDLLPWRRCPERRAARIEVDEVRNTSMKGDRPDRVRCEGSAARAAFQRALTG